MPSSCAHMNPPRNPTPLSLSDWQSWVADGIGRVHHGVLCIAGPEITPKEWAARYVTSH